MEPAQISADVEKALRVAEQIIAAIVKKFPKHKGFVRRYETGETGFIELVLAPETGGKAQEVTTAYSDEYFLSANKENINEKAKRILRDFRIHFGVKETK